MDIAFWIFLALTSIMYLEGVVVSIISSMMLKPPQWALILMVVFWPIALPYMAFKAYKVIQPLMEQMQQLQQLQSNLPPPFMGSLMGNTTMEDLIKDQTGQNL